MRLTTYPLLTVLGLALWVSTAGQAMAAELEVRLDNPSSNRNVRVMLFDSAEKFVDLRNPVRVINLPPGTRSIVIPDVPAGEYAAVIYADENDNGILDKNFIGIPREPLGFSNRYWPQGPPTFARAAFQLGEDEIKPFDVELQSVFGDLGLIGLGVGVIAQTSPYRDAKQAFVQPIPAISYIGDRLQVLGLGAQYGILSLGNDVRIAATLSYRFGKYEENDSPYLEGLGDRDDTLMGGLAAEIELPAGFELSAGYEHDMLDQIGGGIGSIGLGKSFQPGFLTMTPKVGLLWLSSDVANYDYGVPENKALDDRPAYRPDSAVGFEAGISFLREIYAEWRIIVSVGVTILPSEITESPIVDEGEVFDSLVVISRLF